MLFQRMYARIPGIRVTGSHYARNATLKKDPKTVNTFRNEKPDKRHQN
jgi:hypothetical protein